jgi:hypothetical protein
MLLWRATDFVDGRVERHVVLTLDATLRTAVILTLAQAGKLADGLRAATARRAVRLRIQRLPCRTRQQENRSRGICRTCPALFRGSC